MLGPVGIEALRLARRAVKEAITEKGGKISDYSDSEITRLAFHMIETDKSWTEKAQTNVAKMMK